MNASCFDLVNKCSIQSFAKQHSSTALKLLSRIMLEVFHPVLVAVLEYKFFVEIVRLRLSSCNALGVVNHVNWRMIIPEALDLLDLVVVFVDEAFALLCIRE